MQRPDLDALFHDMLVIAPGYFEDDVKVLGGYIRHLEAQLADAGRVLAGLVSDEAARDRLVVAREFSMDQAGVVWIAGRHRYYCVYCLQQASDIDERVKHTPDCPVAAGKTWLAKCERA